MSNIIVVGSGRVGSQLATKLTSGVNNVCVIDSNPDAFAALGQNFNGNTVTGVGFDEDTLKLAGVEDCDTLLAVTDSDNSNLMIAEVASRIFNVNHVITRLQNPDHAQTYTQLGIDYVCGTTLVADELYEKSLSQHGAEMQVFGDFEILEFSLDLSSIERDEIRVIEMERVHDVRIIAYERADGSANSIPMKDTKLYNGDTVIAIVRIEFFDKFKKFILE